MQLPLFTSCLEDEFSETHFQDPARISALPRSRGYRTAGKHDSLPQDVVPAHIYTAFGLFHHGGVSTLSRCAYTLTHVAYKTYEVAF